MVENPQSRRNATVVMAGLPKTGKTTFLGALYHVLESGDSGLIELQTMPDTRRYVEAVRQRWLRVEPESRTSASSPIMNELNLSINGGCGNLALCWPDLSGEYFLEMVRNRTLNHAVATILRDATALLFFVHPDTVSQSPRIDDLNKISLAFGTDPDDNDAQEEGKENEKVELKAWDPLLVPGEVLTVELLQRILASNFPSKVGKIALVLSAWDTLSPLFESPTAYFERKLPMLHQLIEANSDVHDMKMYGVSALGGDPKEDKEKLLGHISAIERILVVDGTGVPMPNGILSPIQWLLG